MAMKHDPSPGRNRPPVGETPLVAPGGIRPMNVETQAWRENVERVQRGLTGGMKDQWEAQKSLDALTTQREELEQERDFKDEANCDLLERLEYAERDLASSQQAALLLHKRVEELEEALERIMASCQHPGDYLSMELLHIEGNARAALAARPAPLARDPEWPAQEC